MKIKSFGCSFIYGSDLPDCPHGDYVNHLGPSALTWPALLSKRFAVPYECHAWPGVGNLKILERILYHCHDPDPAIFLISWTWIDRFDYIVDHQQPWNNFSWRSVMPNDDTVFAKQYYSIYHSQIKDQMCNLIWVKTAIETLQRLKIQFVMTCMDDLLFNKLYIAHEGISDLQQSLKKYISYFDGLSFLEWSKSMDYEISTRMHPLEQAHQEACQYVIDNWITADLKDKLNG